MSVLAVSLAALESWGCPNCGYRSGNPAISGHGGLVWRCGECGETCIGLAGGMTVSPFGFASGDGLDEYPTLSVHPRQGTPAHGRPDTRPEGGGEFFSSRGIGLDNTPGCFVCGGGERMRNNIAAFVQCRAAGERVVAMFASGARLDYRAFEPDRVQVKIGACSTHLPNLQRLHDLIGRGDERGVITAEMIAEAVAVGQVGDQTGIEPLTEVMILPRGLTGQSAQA